MMLKNNHKPKCKPVKLLADNVPEKDVELCLEVEMDDEVKDIISFPGKYGSTLLDVTVIKPKDIDKLYSAHKKTMSSDAVRKFITSMSMESSSKEKRKRTTSKDRSVSPKEQKETNMKSSGDQPKHTGTVEKHKHITNKFGDAFFDNLKKMYTTDDTNSELFLNRHENDRVKQIYAAPKTYHDFNSRFECQRKKKREQNEKLNAPCLCQNCAIVGIVTDSQKKPFATEMMYDPKELPPMPRKETREEYKMRKQVNFKPADDHTQCQYYFLHLSEKIHYLEARIAVQEEKSVPKDYFRRIVTKLVAHITKLTTGSQIKIANEPQPKKQKEPHKHVDKNDNYGHKYVVNPILIDNKIPAEKENCRQHKDIPCTSNAANANQVFWKWGEDILKPGIDLKNKIIDLMEDTLNNLKKTKNRTKEEEIKHFVDEFSNNLYRTVHETPERDAKTRNKQEFTKGYGHCAESEDNNKNRKKMGKIFTRREEPVSVEYINSQILKWHDTETTFKFESSDQDSMRAADFRVELYRAEFMKTLLNTKEEDKMKLWHSIWNQASASGQSKEDKVTIQLPDKRDPTKNIEIFYSLGELEALLMRKRSRIK